MEAFSGTLRNVDTCGDTQLATHQGTANLFVEWLCISRTRSGQIMTEMDIC